MKVPSWAKFSFRILVTALLLILLVRHVSWMDMRAALVGVNPEMLGLGFSVMAINLVVAVVRWNIILLTYFTRFPFTQVIRLYLVGNFFNVLTPGNLAGDVVRGYQTSKLGVGISDAYASVVTDRIVGLLGLTGMAGMGILLGWTFLVGSGLLRFCIIGIAVIIVFLMLLYGQKSLKKSSVWFSLRGKFNRTILSFLENLKSYPRKHPGIFVKCLFIAMVSHSLIILSVYIFARSLGVVVSPKYFLLFIPLIGIFSMIPVTIGGLGLREAGYVFLFTQVGMPEATTLCMSLLFFTSIILLALPGGILFILPNKSIMNNAVEQAEVKVIP